MVHATFIGVQLVYFPGTSRNPHWRCGQCDGAMTVGPKPFDGGFVPPIMYYFWCRCGNTRLVDVAEVAAKEDG